MAAVAPVQLKAEIPETPIRICCDMHLNGQAIFSLIPLTQKCYPGETGFLRFLDFGDDPHNGRLTWAVSSGRIVAPYPPTQ